MVSFVGIMSATAQEIDSLLVEERNTVVDSLVNKLNKLQQDYDFLSYEFKLNKLHNDIQNFCNEVNIKSNQIIVDHFHGGFNYELYKAYKANYDVSVSKLESLKELAAATKESVILGIILSNFNEEQINVLGMEYDLLDYLFKSADAALGYYKVALELY